MKDVYKCHTKKFFNEEGRFIYADGYEWLILKDMFNWLGRLTDKQQIETTDRRKLDKFLENINRIEGMQKFKIEAKGEKYSRAIQNMYCIKFDIVEKHWNEIQLLFKKGTVCTKLRPELNFVQTVKDFFKYSKPVSIEVQWNVMEFRIDLVIGRFVFVEFDEDFHKKQIQKDIERMQKIALSQSYDENGFLMNTNDYKRMNYKYDEYENFNTYEFNGALFIRVSNSLCLNWIPLVYEYYDEYIDFLYEKPIKTPFKHSSELINYKYSS